MVSNKSSLLFIAISVSILFVTSCATNTTTSPTTPSPVYSPPETTPLTPTSSYTGPINNPKITITSTPIPNYTPSGAIQEKLQEVEQAFGRAIPIPTYLPEGYAITDAQFIQKQGSYAQAELIITALDKPDISLQIEWGPELWLLKPSSDDYQYFKFDDGNGSYGSVVLNRHSDHNTIWWDWLPEILPTSGRQSMECYEMALSASIEVPEEELVNIVRFITTP
jgi:hypothetical protein